MTASSNPVVEWTDQSTEQAIHNSVAIDEPWAAVEKLGTLVRLSGSKEEREAVSYLTSRLDEFGVKYTLHEPECFISIPRGASVRTIGNGGVEYRAKTVSMSVSTGGSEITGELVYVPSGGSRAQGIDIFSSGINATEEELAGKIIITEGMAAPGKVQDAAKLGVIAGIFINPGEYIHEGICTTIWGTPDLNNMHRQPSIPAINVNYPDGQKLIEHARSGGSVALSTTLELDWRPIPVLVAEIPGTQVPEEFVLVHGHLDGWHYGVADNATGDASLLEMARVFHEHRGKLARSVRIAWWSGHSHGRYAGATWYADVLTPVVVDPSLPNRSVIAAVSCTSRACTMNTSYI
jgi:N-acetylated-alpha-linked acidic dipeptidase